MEKNEGKHPEIGEIVPIPEQIETEHVVLKPLTLDDAPDIFEHRDEEITRYMSIGPFRNIQNLRSFMEIGISHIRMGREYLFAIRSKEDEFLGEIGLHEGGLPRKAAPELSIWLKSEVQQKGYGYEAATALIEWARQNLMIEYIIYKVDERNMPSRKLAEGLGGEYTGEEEIEDELEKTTMRVYQIDNPEE
jgi:RimJ/RimL family protein N-acetyltransferase